jgi:hypothetical protein
MFLRNLCGGEKDASSGNSFFCKDFNKMKWMIGNGFVAKKDKISKFLSG